jgi:hypothetical protein
VNRARKLGASAAATLPAALFAAVLVSAPFAGTTTAPLADSQPAGAHAPTAQQPAPDRGLDFTVSASDVAMLAGFEACLVAVGGGVIVTAVRRRRRSVAVTGQRSE